VTAVRNRRPETEPDGEVEGRGRSARRDLNNMTDTHATLPISLSVAREVGVEGRLGGQGQRARAARNVEGFDRQRQPACGHLTSQVRAIAEVATAVTKGT